MITISTDVLVFFLAYYGTDGSYKDLLVAAFLTVAGTITLCCLFLPKVYIIIFRPEKNVPYRKTTLGTIEREKLGNPRKVSGRSNTSFVNSDGNHDSNDTTSEHADRKPNAEAACSDTDRYADGEGDSSDENSSSEELQINRRKRRTGANGDVVMSRDGGAERLTEVGADDDSETERAGS